MFPRAFQFRITKRLLKREMMMNVPWQASYHHRAPEALVGATSRRPVRGGTISYGERGWAHFRDHLCISPFTHCARFQIIEGVASGSLNFVSGLLFVTLSTWPRAAIPAGILFGNAILVSVLVSATAPATGAHINPLVTMAILFSGLCHPVRAAIYIFCQLVGGALGGALLRVALGRKLAYETHNAGCWIDPAGEVDVWQAALIEFTSVFILLFVLFPFDQR